MEIYVLVEYSFGSQANYLGAYSTLEKAQAVANVDTFAVDDAPLVWEYFPNGGWHGYWDAVYEAQPLATVIPANRRIFLEHVDEYYERAFKQG